MNATMNDDVSITWFEDLYEMFNHECACRWCSSTRTLLKRVVSGEEPCALTGMHLLEWQREQMKKATGDTALAQLPFSYLVIRVLARECIHSLQRLLGCTPSGLMNIFGFGKTSLREVRVKLGWGDLHLSLDCVWEPEDRGADHV